MLARAARLGDGARSQLEGARSQLGGARSRVTELGGAMSQLGGAGAELRATAKAAGALRPALKRPSASGTRSDLSEPSQARLKASP